VRKLKRRKGRDRPYSNVIQEHHISYCASHILNPDKFPCKGCPNRNKTIGCWIVRVFKGEHWILTQMSRFTQKKVSKGFLTAINQFLEENKGRATEI